MIERYTRASMKRIWSEENKFKAWLDVELAAVKAWEELGRIPKGTYDRIARKAKFTVKGIEEIEKVTNHDVIAFTTDVASYVGEDSKWIHLGLTSSDVVDTAQALILREAIDEVIEGVVAVKENLKDLALKHKDTMMMGRTHGVHAEPTTFGAKVAVWYDEMCRNHDRLLNARNEVAVGKMSGAVGNFAHCPPKLEESVMRALDLEPAPASSQVVQRDSHAVLMFTLAVIGGTLEKIAVTLRGLQRTEIGEVMEGFEAGQKGSSAMPHKRNPVMLERITGLARLLRGNAHVACENQALWDERDISHSSVERVIFADSLTIADYILDKMAGVISRLVIDERKMEENMRLTKGVYFSQTVLLRLIDKGLLREKAYEVVQRNAMKTHEEGTPFYDNLLKDEDVMDVLDREELAECFSSRHFSQNTGYILYRVGILDAPPIEAMPQQTVAQTLKQVGRGRDNRRRQPKQASQKQAKPDQPNETSKPAPEPKSSSRGTRHRAPVRNPKPPSREVEPPKAEERNAPPAQSASAPPPPPEVTRRVVETKAYEAHKRVLLTYQPARQQPKRYLSPKSSLNQENNKKDDNEEINQEEVRKVPRHDESAFNDEPSPLRSTDATRQQRSPINRPQRRGRPVGQQPNPPRQSRPSHSTQQTPPPEPPKHVDEDAQPPQVEDWRNTNSRSVIDSNYRNNGDSRSRRKR